MLENRDQKTPLLLVFMAINFVLICVDVLISHSQNNFFRFEMIPIIYSPIAVIAILGNLVLPGSKPLRQAFRAIMWLGVAVGVVGTYFHLAGNATSNQEPLFRLVVTGSPVAAPIAYAGVSLFTLAVEHYRDVTRKEYLLQLIGLGFLGATLAAFLDHARLGFVPVYTIIPLTTGLLATLSCFWQANTVPDKMQEKVFLATMGLNLVAGIIGFGLHAAGNLAGTTTLVLERFMYRNPMLGPLLFCNLSMLGALSILPEKFSLNFLRHRVPEKNQITG